MGSKPKTSQQQGKKGIFGMGPGQSLAMAGNTGLATMEQKQAEQIQQGLKNLGQPSSFKAIGQNVDEVGSKYRRPADVDSYARDMQQLNEALAAGGKFFRGPDGIERINLNKTGIKDDQGRTILSKQIPNLNAMAPTLGQLGGDIGRAITGYNSLQYTDPDKLGINKMEMVRTQGLADVLAKAAIPGSLALNIVQDLYGKGKNFFFPEEEDDESSAADAMGGAAAINLGDIRTQKNLAGTTGDEIDQLTQREVGPTVDLRTPTIEELVTTPVSQTGETTSPTIADYLSSGFGGARPSENALFNPQEGFMYPKDYTLPFTNIEVPSLGRAIESAVTGGQGFDAEMNLTPEGDILYNELIEEFDFTPEDAIERIKVMDRSGLRNSGIPLYADGGLTKTVAPQEGPMSAGVASLFKNK